MVIIDTLVNTLFGGLTLDPAGMHCPSWDDAFVSSFCFFLVCFFLIFDVIFSIAKGVQHDGRLPFWKPASVFAHYVCIV